jgi:hypothetical protein
MKKYYLLFALIFFGFECMAQSSYSARTEPYSSDSLKWGAGQDEDNTYYFHTVFMPGLSYSLYQPKAKDSLGHFSGITVEYLLYAHVHQTNDPGPSHFRIYLKLNILNSDKSDIRPLFGYTLGVDLSLEKNPKRTFLVPYFGLECGEMVQKQFGSVFQFTPILGIHILSHRNIFINVHGGYVYPFKNYDQLQGWFGQAGIDFALW